MDEEALIASITALARSNPPPEERVLRRVIAILEQGRGDSTGLGGFQRDRQWLDSSSSTQRSGYAQDLVGLQRQGRAIPDRREHKARQGRAIPDRHEHKARLQPTETTLEHMSLNVGGDGDPRRQKYLAAQRQMPPHPVNEREAAVRKFQHQMETAPHADAFAEDMTQIAGMAFKGISMTHDLKRFGAMSDMEGNLHAGRPAWYSEGPSKYDGALDQGPMRF